VASLDEEVMIQEKRVVAAATLRNLTHLFETLDKSGDGFIDPSEFSEMLQDKIVRTWFSAIGVEVDEVHELFSLIDVGDGRVSRDEFIMGIKAVRGLARGIDLLMLTREVKKMDVLQQKLEVLLLDVDRRIRNMNSVESIPNVTFGEHAV